VKKIKEEILKILNFPSCIYNKFVLLRRRISAGKKITIWGRLDVHGGGHISIGNNCVIVSNSSRNPVGGGNRQTIFFVGKNGHLNIGCNVAMTNTAISCKTRVIIGDNVMIGANVKIYDTDFHSINFESRITRPDPDIRSLPVEIKDGAFIGAHSIILKGIIIGKESVVGAGSVVSKSIPDGEIWGGNPAKLIRKLGTDSPKK